MKKLAIIALPLAVLSGCMTTQNERLWVGTPQKDPAYGWVSAPAFSPIPRPEHPLKDDAPSTPSLVRAEWQPQVFAVPMDGVASHRTYTYELFYADDTARQRGQMPSALSSLELSGETRWIQYVECWVNPLLAASDALLLPARMITHSPGTEVLVYPATFWRASEFTARRVSGEVFPAPVMPRGQGAAPDAAPVERKDVPNK